MSTPPTSTPRSITAERLSRRLAVAVGSRRSLALHGLGCVVWAILNAGVVPSIHPFDPFPFRFLTMMMSLESLFLALLILGRQNGLAAQINRNALDHRTDQLAGQRIAALLPLLSGFVKQLELRANISRMEELPKAAPSQRRQRTHRLPGRNRIH